MEEIRWRDEKLYKISPKDYGDALHRTLGAAVHSIAKGIAIAFAITALLLVPGLSFRDWFFLFLLLALISSIGVAVADRVHYIREIEIRPDQVLGYEREKAVGIGREQVREIAEGVQWTMFGRVNGIVIKGKKNIVGMKNIIFIPAGSPDYAEIRSRLNSWYPISS